MPKKGLNNTLNDRFNRMLLYSFITAFVTGLIGLILLLIPGSTSAKIVGILTGIVFLISGITSIYKYFHRDGAKLYSLSIAFGVLYSILGVFVIVYPYSVITFVTVCLAIYLMITGAVKINFAFWLKKGEEASWLVTLVTGIFLLVLAVLVLFNPFVLLTITKLAGAFLLMVSILDISDTVLFWKRSKEIMDIFW